MKGLVETTKPGQVWVLFYMRQEPALIVVTWRTGTPAALSIPLSRSQSRHVLGV
jgi:hypothetical protein